MTSDEQEIRRLVDTWMSATKAGDLETILGLMAEDAVFLRAAHPALIRRAEFAAAAKAPADQKRPRFEGTSDIQEITVLGDWAFMWSKLTVVATPPDGGPPTTRAGYTLSILKKENGKWLLARDANMLTPL